MAVEYESSQCEYVILCTVLAAVFTTVVLLVCVCRTTKDIKSSSKSNADALEKCILDTQSRVDQLQRQCESFPYQTRQMKESLSDTHRLVTSTLYAVKALDPTGKEIGRMFSRVWDPTTRYPDSSVMVEIKAMKREYTQQRHMLQHITVILESVANVEEAMPIVKV